MPPGGFRRWPEASVLPAPGTCHVGVVTGAIEVVTFLVLHKLDAMAPGGCHDTICAGMTFCPLDPGLATCEPRGLSARDLAAANTIEDAALLMIVAALQAS